jgi:hypothetical protein
MPNLINEFRHIESNFLNDIFLRGQRASPINQTDIDGVISTGEIIIAENIVQLTSKIGSLELEIEDIKKQLSEPIKIRGGGYQKQSLFRRAVGLIFKNQ